MRSRFIKAYTLVEMLVALAVSAIIIAATYASYEMVATQYHKNMDIANMHTSGRAIMRIIERDVRMAGFEYRDKDAKITYGSISNPLTIKDSGNKCCDEVTVIYDYFDEESKKAERIRIRYWTEPHTSNKGSRHRLYKQKDILGQNKKMLAKPKLGTKDVMADYIEDLQLVGSDTNNGSKSARYVKLDKNGKVLADSVNNWSCVKDNKTGIIWEAKTDDGGMHDKDNRYTFKGKTWYHADAGTLASYAYKNSLCGYGYSQKCSNSYNKKCMWTIPTKEDFKSIIVTGNGSPTINKKYFPNTESSGYWIRPTPGTCSNGRGQVNFRTGTTSFRCSSSSPFANFYLRLSYATEHTSSDTYNLISINLTLRTKNQYGKDRQFKKQDYHGGNFKIDKTDKYKRDTFSTTVLVRNLAL